MPRRGAASTLPGRAYTLGCETRWPLRGLQNTPCASLDARHRALCFQSCRLRPMRAECLSAKILSFLTPSLSRISPHAIAYASPVPPCQISKCMIYMAFYMARFFPNGYSVDIPTKSSDYRRLRQFPHKSCQFKTFFGIFSRKLSTGFNSHFYILLQLLRYGFARVRYFQTNNSYDTLGSTRKFLILLNYSYLLIKL